MKLVHIFFDVSMSNGHFGLQQLMKKEGKELDGSDHYAVFVNKSWMALKMLTPSNVLLHYKAKSAKLGINPDTIKHLPNCVEGGELNYSRALSAVITKQFEEKLLGGKR